MRVGRAPGPGSNGEGTRTDVEVADLGGSSSYDADTQAVELTEETAHDEMRLEATHEGADHSVEDPGGSERPKKKKRRR